METQSDEETEGLVTLLQLVRRSAGLPLTEDPLPWLLRNEVRSRILPFLRCACIFFHYITGVRVPDQLYGRILQINTLEAFLLINLK